ncbi:MAG: hypothetical protein ACYDH6_12940 [Acidimicrobiales bacterium]
MGVEKMSVSFDLELGEQIKTSATRQGESVSAWLAAAARDRLRNQALGEAVDAWQKEFGRLTDAEMAEAGRVLDRATKRRSGAA